MGMAEQEKINRMQKNLSVIRNVARWTTERLGEEIGVSRQTINSLEHNKTKMTKTQYLALRAVFNHEAMISENTALAQVIQSLVDEPVEEALSDETEESSGAEDEAQLDAMDGMSVATNVLADRKMAAAIAEALPTAMAAAMPPLTSLVVLPIVKQMMKRGR